MAPDTIGYVAILLSTAVMLWRTRKPKDSLLMTTLAEVQALNATATDLLAEFKAITAANATTLADAIAAGAKALADAEASAEGDPAVEAELATLGDTLGQLKAAMDAAPGPRPRPPPSPRPFPASRPPVAKDAVLHRG